MSAEMADKIAAATRRLRELREMAARLPAGDAKANANADIDRVAVELARGVQSRTRRK
jgi:hypothetical protein